VSILNETEVRARSAHLRLTETAQMLGIRIGELVAGGYVFPDAERREIAEWVGALRLDAEHVARYLKNIEAALAKAPRPSAQPAEAAR